MAESKLILEPGQRDQLINPAFDRYMDAPCTRRELQAMIDHFSKHLDQIYGSQDTSHVIINLLAEKAGVTKGEIQAYVTKKKQELIDLLEAQAAAKANASAAQTEPTAPEAAVEQSNG